MFNPQQEQGEEQCREKQHSQQQKAKSEQCYREWLAGKAAQERRRRAALQRMTNRKKAEELQVRPMTGALINTTRFVNLSYVLSIHVVNRGGGDSVRKHESISLL